MPSRAATDRVITAGFWPFSMRMTEKEYVRWAELWAIDRLSADNYVRDLLAQGDGRFEDTP